MDIAGHLRGCAFVPREPCAGKLEAERVRFEMAATQNQDGSGSAREVSQRDSYMILGVTPTSDLEAIKKNYRDLAKRYHPDLHPDHASGEKMKELKFAYDQVSSQAARRVYDLQAHFRMRVPAEFGKVVSEGMRRKRRPAVTLWGRIVGAFSRKAAATQARQQYQMFFSAGLTCAQVPGAKLMGEAEIDFEKALEFNPTGIDAHYNLGLALYWQGKYPEALARFQAVLKLQPKDPGARRMVELLRG